MAKKNIMQKALETLKSKAKVPNIDDTGQSFNMSSQDHRVKRIQEDFENAKANKTAVVEKFKMLDALYELEPYSKDQILQFMQDEGINMEATVLTDAFSQIESAINTSIPAFQFAAREGNCTPEQAQAREDVVNFIMYQNNMMDKNSLNERVLHKLGTSFWMVRFDDKAVGLGYTGEIKIIAPSPANIFVDPSAYCLEEAEYVIYAYRMHKRAAERAFGKKRINLLTTDSNHTDTEYYDNRDDNSPVDDNSFQVVEYYYRDDDGDIAMSVIIDSTEVKFREKYWSKTKYSGNKNFPIVDVRLVPREKSFWGIGDLEKIAGLIDTANKEYFSMIMNNIFMGNDIILMEEDCEVEGETLEVKAGAIWRTKPNKVDRIRRLGGIANVANNINTLEYIQGQIENTNGNFASNMGKEPERVVTASGIAQMNERADRRINVKEVGRDEGFRRLAVLLDWMALEFYDDNRTIKITNRGVRNGEKFKFNSDNMAIPKDESGILDDESPYKDDALADNSDEEAQDVEIVYFPSMDVIVDAGDGVKRSKAFTLAATQELMQYPVNQSNIGIFESMVELLDLPNKKAIIKSANAAVEMMMAEQQAKIQATQTQSATQVAQTAQQGQQMQAEQGAPPQGAGPSEADVDALVQMLADKFPEQLKKLNTLDERAKAEIIMALMAAKSEEEFAEILSVLG